VRECLWVTSFEHKGARREQHKVLQMSRKRVYSDDRRVYTHEHGHGKFPPPFVSIRETRRPQISACSTTKAPNANVIVSPLSTLLIENVRQPSLPQAQASSNARWPSTYKRRCPLRGSTDELNRRACTNNSTRRSTKISPIAAFRPHFAKKGMMSKIAAGE